ncbi:hypothetical protein [Flavobacterium sp.]|uniref:hypothetical protein n=1 Tax=Flavobacterium sp. TaxID=239 RepID=UPI002627705F|nr:hypothetical protein [Flavobacterium sp.]
MKKILFLLLVGTQIVCAQATQFVNMQIPSKYLSRASETETFVQDVTVTSKDGRVTERGQMRITVPLTGEGVSKIELSANILRIGGIGADFFVRNPQNFQTYAEEPSHSQCIDNCNKKYTSPDGERLPGRGACKFNCWVSTTVRILEAIATIRSGK